MRLGMFKSLEACAKSRKEANPARSTEALIHCALCAVNPMHDDKWDLQTVSIEVRCWNVSRVWESAVSVSGPPDPDLPSTAVS